MKAHRTTNFTTYTPVVGPVEHEVLRECTESERRTHLAEEMNREPRSTLLLDRRLEHLEER